MIYAIGETLLDIIFTNNEPTTAKPGGSALNSSVSLGRMNIPVSFISEWGTDKVGQLINNFLKKNNVITKNVYRYNDTLTTVAMAFLDKNKDADYQFYKNFPKKRLNIKLPKFYLDDMLLFSSYFAINKEVRPKFLEIVKKAKSEGALIIYDPNFRKSHANELHELKNLILENISLADIVRGSDEDFENIFGVNNSEEAYKKIKKAGCFNLIYTANKNGVYIHSGKFQKQYEVPQIKPVSTIGAGDNFNAGIIYGLYKNNITKNKLMNSTTNQWDNIVQLGINFATDACLRYENYISIDFAKKNRNTGYT